MCGKDGLYSISSFYAFGLISGVDLHWVGQEGSVRHYNVLIVTFANIAFFKDYFIAALFRFACLVNGFFFFPFFLKTY